MICVRGQLTFEAEATPNYNSHDDRFFYGFREKLADADPPVEELAQRLRSWDAAMTRIKTDGLLAELPTKRLLMQYAQGFVNRADPPGNLQVQCSFGLLPSIDPTVLLSLPGASALSVGSSRRKFSVYVYMAA